MKQKYNRNMVKVAVTNVRSFKPTDLLYVHVYLFFCLSTNLAIETFVLKSIPWKMW